MAYFSQRALNRGGACEMSLPPSPTGDPAVLSWIAARCYRELGLDQRPAEREDDPLQKNREHVRLWLRRTVETGSLDVYARADAGDLLALLGDDRPGVLELPTSLDDEGFWTRVIKPGLFRAGKRSKDGPPREHGITTPYRIGRYLITNAQFQKFVAARGYENKTYWTEAGWAWKCGEEKRRIQDTQPPLQDRYNSAERGQGFHLVNRPVVKVCWYEAQAYCLWLSEQLDLHPGRIRLPSELEWERAARGTDGPEYPRLGTSSENYCNNGELKIRTTTAVGMFGCESGSLGGYDFAGNVWEWCSSSSELENPTLVECSLSPMRKGTLRGGSWGSAREFANYVSRDAEINEGYSDVDVGFRIIAIPSHNTHDCQNCAEH